MPTYLCRVYGGNIFSSDNLFVTLERFQKINVTLRGFMFKTFFSQIMQIQNIKKVYC